jgi:predicted DNA-binding transcriptional regulator
MNKMTREKKGFRIPITMDVPPEVSSSINERVAEDITYVTLKAKIIEKTYNNLRKQTALRKVGEYLLNNWNRGELSINEIARALKISEGSVKLLIADLNFWGAYPLKMIPIRGRAGYIQSCVKDIEVTEQYLKQKSRTIASMEQVYENVNNRIKIKKDEYAEKKSSKEKIKEKEKIKKNEDED